MPSISFHETLCLYRKQNQFLEIKLASENQMTVPTVRMRPERQTLARKAYNAHLAG